MIYKLKFDGDGKVRSFKQCSNPSLGHWVHSTQPIGTLNHSGGNTPWKVGSKHLILEAHHLSGIVKGLQTWFRDTEFQLPTTGMVYIQHQYWQSPQRQSTLTLMNVTKPGYRAMAEKAEHRHRLVLGTGAVAGRGDWNVSCFGLLSITGAQLALAISAHKKSLKHAGNINQDVAEEALSLVAAVGSFFGA